MIIDTEDYEDDFYFRISDLSPEQVERLQAIQPDMVTRSPRGGPPDRLTAFVSVAGLDPEKLQAFLEQERIPPDGYGFFFSRCAFVDTGIMRLPPEAASALRAIPCDRVDFFYAFGLEEPDELKDDLLESDA